VLRCSFPFNAGADRTVAGAGSSRYSFADLSGGIRTFLSNEERKMLSQAFVQTSKASLFRIASLAAAAVAIAAIATPARAQVASNTARNIRPLVWFRDISAANPSTTALGIFDTGGSSLFIPPETNTVFGITNNAATAAATWANGGAAANYGMVGQGTSFNAGGFMGGGFSGPEGMTAGVITTANPLNPTHIFNSVSNIANTALAGRINVSPSLSYFNAVSGAYPEPNIGAAFYDASPAGAPALVAEIDPTNATFLPFASGSINAGAVNGGQAGATALKGPSIPLDQVSSSISYMFASSYQDPSIAFNPDPGFTITLPLAPYNLNRPAGTDTAAASFITYTDANSKNATRGARPFYIAGPGNPFGLAVGSYLVDSGAPTTDPATATDSGIIGTDILNGYGQYWDFTNNLLMLFGPQSAADKNIVGPGILFDARTSLGLANTGVNQLATNGSLPVNNAISSTQGGAAIPSDGIAGQQSSAIFSSQLSHSNKAYISGISALTLQKTDQINGLSMGADQIGTPTEGVLIAAKPGANPASTGGSGASNGPKTDVAGLPGPDNCALFFSVDPNSQGIAGSGVAQQAALGKQSAQMYLAMNGNFSDTGHLGETNTLKYSGDLLGLGPNSGFTASAAGRGQVDQLGDFVLETQRGYYTDEDFPPGPGNMANAATVQRNTDPMITNMTQTPFNPGGGVGTQPPPAGSITASRGDIYGQNFDTYFTLDKASPTLGAKNFNSAEVFEENPAPGAGAATGFHVFATNTQLGLNPGDDIEALTLSRVLMGQNIVQPGGPDTSPSMIGNFDENTFGDFAGVDPFNGGSSDYGLFTLARGSPDLSIFDPVIGRDLSSADVFVTDFDGSFALYSTAESLGLNASTDEITGLKPLPYADVPEPATLGILSLIAAAGLRRRRRAIEA
jgi:hypothetical protein